MRGTAGPLVFNQYWARQHYSALEAICERQGRRRLSRHLQFLVCCSKQGRSERAARDARRSDLSVRNNGRLVGLTKSCRLCVVALME
jgi:hypothetical protein